MDKNEHGDATDGSDIWTKMQQFADAVDGVENTFADVVALTHILLSDSAAIGQLLKLDGDSPFLRRMLVKNQMAHCEGSLWVMKQLALRSRAEFFPPLTDVEKALLEDKQYRLHDSGEVREEKAKITLAQNLRFITKILARMKGCEEFTIEFGSDGARSFFKAVAVRDRLTHPKLPEQMEVSTDEVKAALEGVQWFNNNFLAFNAIRKKATEEDRITTTAALVAEARQHGATEEQINAFLKRVHPLYTAPATDDGQKNS